MAIRDHHDFMTKADDKENNPTPAGARRARMKTPAGFDLWLTRGLHQMFDAVANEPIPSELLKLIEEDKLK